MRPEQRDPLLRALGDDRLAQLCPTAHKATRLTILAIDLIVSRRRSGKLEIKGQDEKTTARELPEEVWELVKDQLLGVDVRKAEMDTLARFRCAECIERDGEGHTGLLNEWEGWSWDQ